MVELTRTFVSRLRQYLGDRRHARRRRARLPFNVSLARAAGRNGSRRVPSLDGHTFDVSETGIALVAPAIRIGGDYLVGDNLTLRVKLELPTGPVEMDVNPVRYESLEEHHSEDGYLIGVRIVRMSESDNAHYLQYVGKLMKGVAPI